MAVSKRTRYEVLKRDSHTCRYCGASAPDATLTVDHVTPVALGGSDSPDNLVAACRDCNAGKASTSPGAEAVADVKQLDMQWAGAIKRVATARARQAKKRSAYILAFADHWNSWATSPFQWLPDGWESSIGRFYDVGVPIDELRYCVDVACGNKKVGWPDTYRYFAGCTWRVVTEIQDAAKEILDGEVST